MAKRSITDEEIALIKAMLDRGMKNKDIQFFFNRPNRAVNSGRISQIGDGSYSNSADIPAASREELDTFIAANQPSPDVPEIIVSGAIEEAGPLSKPVLARLFAKDQDGVWWLESGESDTKECKANFNIKNATKWLKPMAALANNLGGYIFFGIQDGGGEASNKLRVVGMKNDDFAKADPADLSQRLRSIFDPTPRFETTIIELDEAVVGVIHVEQHPSRPVVATKNDKEIKEGDIYFRYSGESARIKYSDLRAILDTRDVEARINVLPMVERLLQLGSSRAMIVDLEGGQLVDGNRSIQIDESLLDQVSFIKEGEFDEKSGEPTLRLVGDVQSVGSPTIVKKGIVGRADMLEAFLDDELQAEPIDYVVYAIENSVGEWLPIRRFADAASLSKEGLIKFINEASATDKRKATYIDRISSNNAAYIKPTMTSSEILNRIRNDDYIHPSNADEAYKVAVAFQGLEHPLGLDPDRLRKILKKCYEISKEKPQSKPTVPSVTRKAIARLDELLFSFE